MENLELEKKLLKFLGFNISKCDNSKNYIVYDGNDTKIGVIEYKQSENNIQNYEYYTKIRTDNIVITSHNFDRFEFPSLNIYLKNTANIYIHTGNSLLGIDVHTDSNYRLILRIEPDKIWFNFGFQSPYNFHETTEIDLTSQKYTYDVMYTDPGGTIDNYEYRQGILECNSLLNNINFLEIKNTWRTIHNDQDICKQYISKVEGTLEETIKKLGLSIDSFNCMRDYLNNLLPLDEDVILYLIENSKFDLPMIKELFITDNKKITNIKQKTKNRRSKI